MSAGPIGALASALTRDARSGTRTYQPVRRKSYHAGERERRLWLQHNKFDRAEHNCWMTAAEQHDRESKQPGKRNGALGYTAKMVLRLMLRLRNRATGQLDPSYAWLARELSLSPSAVKAAIGRLQRAGLIDWIRRTQRVEDPERPNQYVEQISNAYFFTRPGWLEKLRRRIRREITDTSRNERMKREQPMRFEGRTTEQSLDEIEDPEMRETLMRMHATLSSASPPDGHN